MYNLDITDDFYDFFSMECWESTPPFFYLQNTFVDGEFSISVDNLIVNLSNPIFYHCIESQKKIRSAV